MLRAGNTNIRTNTEREEIRNKPIKRTGNKKKDPLNNCLKNKPDKKNIKSGAKRS